MDFLDANHPDLISTGSVVFTDRMLGFGEAAMIRDPDGHAVRLVN
jgi:hypothetical protein